MRSLNVRRCRDTRGVGAGLQEEFGLLWAILSGVESTLSTAHSVPRRPFALQEPRDAVLIWEVGVPPAFSQIGTIHFASERCRLMLRLTGFGKPSAIWNGKVFAWLLLADRLNMRNMLRRRHYRVANDYTCLLCDNPPEETLAILWGDLAKLWMQTWDVAHGKTNLAQTPVHGNFHCCRMGDLDGEKWQSPSEECPCKHYPTIKSLLIHACTPSEDHNRPKKSSLLKLCMLIYMRHLCLCCLLFESIVNGYQNFL